jgi:predicted hotdog family 3-hydroxylacyl-ACP dehydratase
MQRAFREICSQPGFDAHLEATLERINAIESLGRTRELTIKDFWHGGTFKATIRDRKGREAGTLEIGVVPPPEKEDEKEDDNDD